MARFLEHMRSEMIVLGNVMDRIVLTLFPKGIV